MTDQPNPSAQPSSESPKPSAESKKNESDEKFKVTTTKTEELREKRESHIQKLRNKIEGFEPEKLPSKKEIIQDAKRCLKCKSAPCATCCPVNLPIKDFVESAANENWEEGARIILSSNPMALSTANLCNVRTCCQGGCNLKGSLCGSIHTNKIQLYIMREYMKLYKGLKPIAKKPIGKSVSIVGAGPAGISAGTFLKRMGFDVTIFEKEQYPGGLMMSELLPSRLPRSDIMFEVKLAKDIGIEFRYNQVLGKDFTVDTLHMNYDAVFLAFGRPDDIQIDFRCEGNLSSHTFLRKLNRVLKHGIKEDLPDFKGKKILVLGAGETACDCSMAASRLGGEVTMAFRKDFQGMRAFPFDIEELLEEKIEFLPLSQPIDIRNGTVVFRLQIRDINTNRYGEANDFVVKKYDYIITAFGAALKESKVLLPGEIKDNKIEGYDNVWVGGDLAGSTSVVEAVNDAKVAAKEIAEYFGVDSEIPPFETMKIDDAKNNGQINGKSNTFYQIQKNININFVILLFVLIAFVGFIIRFIVGGKKKKVTKKKIVKEEDAEIEAELIDMQ